MDFLGIDIGCTSIKYGQVSFLPEIKVNNFDMVFVPQTSRNEKYTQALIHLLQTTPVCQAVGFGFPSLVWGDEIKNLAVEFNGIWTHVKTFLRDQNIPCCAINDADAAGVAEVYRREAADLRKGITLVITLGTGIGSAIFLDGKLMPNTELGQLEMHGVWAEKYMAPSVKRRDSLSMREWASRLQEYLSLTETLLSPDHLVLGGGISADFEDFKSLLSTRHAHLIPAYYRNQAGVIGAAMYAAHQNHQYDFI